jgi:hypothetical protein
MKYILIVLFTLVLSSCKCQKNNGHNNLTETESIIINNFIDVELTRELYKNYKDFEIVVIKEAVKEINNLNAYEYAYENWHSNREKATLEENQQFGWILNKLEIKELKDRLAGKEQYYWQASDFKKIKISITKYDEFKKTIVKDGFLKMQDRLIIFLSKPLIINENYAFISFEIGNGKFGFCSITHFTVLMKRERSKWNAKNYFEDGVFN